MPNKNKSSKKPRSDVGQTTRPDTSELAEGGPAPEEVTGRASGTNEDLSALFANDTREHLADGFRGGSNADRGSDLTKDNDTDPDADDDVTAV